MKILNYISSLLPSFERQRILNDIASLQAELSGTTLKMYGDAGATFAKNKFKAKVNVEFDTDFHGKLRDNRSVNFVSAIEAILKSVPAKLSYLEGLVNANYATDMTREAITYQKATVLKYLEVVSFTLSYADRLLLDTLAAETFQNNNASQLIGTNQAPAIYKWMSAHRLDFLNAMCVLAMPLDETREKIESIPDITAIPSNADTVRETVGPAKLDPLGLGFMITTWFNPIYHSRMAFAEWQVERFKAKQEEKRALEYRLFALQESYTNKKDPKLEQQIQYSEGRLQSLNHKLSQLESDYIS
jgi:hypothetical protein